MLVERTWCLHMFNMLCIFLNIFTSDRAKKPEADPPSGGSITVTVASSRPLVTPVNDSYRNLPYRYVVNYESPQGVSPLFTAPRGLRIASPSPMCGPDPTAQFPSTIERLPDSLKARLAKIRDAWHTWKFVEGDIEDIPRQLWRRFRFAHSTCTMDRWIETVMDDIESGEEILRMIGDLLAGDDLEGLDAQGFRALWDEVQEVEARTHWVLATAQIRLELVQTGRADKKPELMRPHIALAS